MAETISKNSGALDLDYQALRLDALALVQKLSGNIWTDFNIHDPGVTLLEEIIFALTELGYKTGFEIEDYLTDKNCEINLQREALYTEEQVKECFPVTAEDYSRFFSRLMAKYGQVEFMSCDNGLYTVHFVPLKDDSLSRKLAEIKILKAFNVLWGEWRILGENVGKVVFDWEADGVPVVYEDIESHFQSSSVIVRDRRNLLDFSPIIEQFPSIYRTKKNGEALQKFLTPIEVLFRNFLECLDNFADLYSIEVLKTSLDNYNQILNQMLAMYGMEFPDDLFRSIHHIAPGDRDVKLLRAKVKYVRFLPALHMHRCGKYFNKRLEIMLGVRTVIVDGIYLQDGFGKVFVLWGFADSYSESTRRGMERLVREELPAHLIPVFYWVPSRLPETVSGTWLKSNECYAVESLWV